MSKTEQAYQSLREDILLGRLVPETSLTISALTDRYGFGWTPLREALSRLETEHLVILELNRGFRVAPVSKVELEDLQFTRRLVELPLFKQSVLLGEGKWREHLKRSHSDLVTFDIAIGDINDKNLIEWELRHDAFHKALVAGARSKWLTRFQHQIIDHLKRHNRALILRPVFTNKTNAPSQSEALEKMFRHAMGLDQHTPIMEAAIAGDADKAVVLLEEHLTLTLDVHKMLEETNG